MFFVVLWQVSWRAMLSFCIDSILFKWKKVKTCVAQAFAHFRQLVWCLPLAIKSSLSSLPLFIMIIEWAEYLGSVWHCGNNDFSECFLLRNTLKYIFFNFFNLFLISAHQNNRKTLKTLIWSKKIIFFKKHNRTA
jgi:hypothetical protein